MVLGELYNYHSQLSSDNNNSTCLVKPRIDINYKFKFLAYCIV